MQKTWEERSSDGECQLISEASASVIAPGQ
jgi:hypothetical protein